MYELGSPRYWHSCSRSSAVSASCRDIERVHKYGLPYRLPMLLGSFPPASCPTYEPPMPCLPSLSRNHAADPGDRSLVFNRGRRVMWLVGTCLEANGVGFARHSDAHFHAPHCPNLSSPPLAALHPAEDVK